MVLICGNHLAKLLPLLPYLIRITLTTDKSIKRLETRKYMNMSGAVSVYNY